MNTTPTRAPQGLSSARRIQWVHGPTVDLGMAVSWVPFAALGWLWQHDPDLIARLVAVTLLISFAHQPLTVALVYGDRRNFVLRRRIFTWSPVAFAVAVLATRQISLTALAIVAGLWNAEHTLMQRYGIVRIYGRKAGQKDGKVEKALLFSWLVLAFVWIAADSRTSERIAQTGMRGKNRRGLDVLAELRPAASVILPLVAIVAALVTVRWLTDEARRGTHTNVAKRIYVASTAALFVTILINPIAGFLGYVGSHAVEYFTIVHQNIGTRYASADADDGAPIGHAVRRLGRAGFLGIYVGIVLLVVGALDRYASPTSYTVVLLTLGGMHVFYDGFIWKRPAPGKGGMLTPATT